MHDFPHMELRIIQLVGATMMLEQRDHLFADNETKVLGIGIAKLTKTFLY